MNVAVKEPVYIIIPVHNRKQITLKCLENLDKSGDLQQYHVVVVDDGSTDGTTEAINNLFPDVKVLPGDGNLWWTGAIKKGMEYAYEQGAEYFVWLNDDCYPLKGAITLLIQSCSNQKFTIVGGQCYEDYTFQDPSYGGQKKLLIGTIPIYAQKNTVVECDALDGNLVCLPRYIVNDINYPPDKKIPHYGGDTIYTWQAQQKGYTLKILGNAIGLCHKNTGDSSWLLSDISIKKRWHNIWIPRSKYYVYGLWNFCLCFWGFRGSLIFIKPYMRLIIITILRAFLSKKMLVNIYIFKNKIFKKVADTKQC